MTEEEEEEAAPAPATTRGDRLLGAAAIALVIIAAVAAWRTTRAGDDLPDEATWRRVASRVRAAARPGDLVTFAPSWIEPLGRMHLGDLVTLEDAGRADSARYARVWVVAARGATSPEIADETPAATFVDGGLTVRRYDRRAAALVDSAFSALPRARLHGSPARPPEIVLAEVGFAPRRCVQLVPQAGSSVTLTFPQLALGDTLVLWAGLADIFTRRDLRAPARLELTVGGRPVGSLSLGVDGGWRALRVPTSPGAADVVVTASAPVRDRLVCFAMESRR